MNLRHLRQREVRHLLLRASNIQKLAGQRTLNAAVPVPRESSNRALGKEQSERTMPVVRDRSPELGELKDFVLKGLKPADRLYGRVRHVDEVGHVRRRYVALKSVLKPLIKQFSQARPAG